MPEEFQINEGFSQAYMSYRRREEIDKLKARYGDVKLFSKDSHSSHPSDECKHVDSTGPQSCSLSTASSSSSSSSSSSDDDMAEREHEDFLILLDALCRNDPALNDPNRRWFRDSAPTLSPNADFAEPSDKSQKKATKADERKLKKSEMPVLLKDYHREFLLKCDGVEDEGLAKAGEEVALMDSDAMLASLRSDASLAVSRQALIQYVFFAIIHYAYLPVHVSIESLV
ncbi:unnamed protein product [Protopolystoma xenopodis]|uniref:Uncharacterized protein n=1 Tax=Protopolystoma xenopodis TaxID=117903 RepID=A0A448WK95_9PLAT|nr:unnamed protein product [Protopolystoma xenopodis]